jgi:hypothetical protein
MNFDLKQLFLGLSLIGLGLAAIGGALNPIGQPSLLPLLLVHIGPVLICFGIAIPFKLPFIGLVVAVVIYIFSVVALISRN